MFKKLKEVNYSELWDYTLECIEDAIGVVLVIACILGILCVIALAVLIPMVIIQRF